MVRIGAKRLFENLKTKFKLLLQFIISFIFVNLIYVVIDYYTGKIPKGMSFIDYIQFCYSKFLLVIDACITEIAFF